MGGSPELPECLVPHIRIAAHALSLRSSNVPNRAPERFLQLLDPPRQLWQLVELGGQSGGSIGYRPWTLRIWTQHSAVIIRWWRHNTLPTLFWALMYRASVKKFRYYNPYICCRWCSFLIWCHNCDLINRWWRHNTLPTLYWPLIDRGSFQKSRY